MTRLKTADKVRAFDYMRTLWLEMETNPKAEGLVLARSIKEACLFRRFARIMGLSPKIIMAKDFSDVIEGDLVAFVLIKKSLQNV